MMLQATATHMDAHMHARTHRIMRISRSTCLASMTCAEMGETRLMATASPVSLLTAEQTIPYEPFPTGFRSLYTLSTCFVGVEVM